MREFINSARIIKCTKIVFENLNSKDVLKIMKTLKKKDLLIRGLPGIDNKSKILILQIDRKYVKNDFKRVILVQNEYPVMF